jgi:DNA sulfur modification protein DndE
MIVETVRLSQKAKEQLIRLKGATGIKNWNVLCRWALCMSLADPTPPSPVPVPADSSVEMTWKVFGGETAEVYAALVRERCMMDGLESEDKVVAEQFRLHLHRGIGMLLGQQSLESILRLPGGERVSPD